MTNVVSPRTRTVSNEPSGVGRGRRPKRWAADAGVDAVPPPLGVTTYDSPVSSKKYQPSPSSTAASIRLHFGSPSPLVDRRFGSVTPVVSAAGRHRKLPPLWSTLNQRWSTDVLGLENHTTWLGPIRSAPANSAPTAASPSGRTSSAGGIGSASAYSCG